MNEDENMAAWFSLSSDWQIGGVVPLVPKYERDEARRVAREWARYGRRMRNERDNWIDSARRFARNEDYYRERAEAAEAELQSCLVHVMNVSEERDEAQTEAEKWRREYETEKRYVNNRIMAWLKNNLEQRQRAEAAEQRVQELERINQQLLEALEKIEYKGRNANVNNRLAIWMGDTARAAIRASEGE